MVGPKHKGERMQLNAFFDIIGVMAIVAAIGGIVALIRGEIAVGRGRKTTGARARIIGLFWLLSIVLNAGPSPADSRNGVSAPADPEAINGKIVVARVIQAGCIFGGLGLAVVLSKKDKCGKE